MKNLFLFVRDAVQQNVDTSESGVKILISEYWDIILKYSMDIMSAVLILVVGWLVIKLICTFVNKIIDKRISDKSVRSFVEAIISVALKIVLAIVVISKLGIDTSSFIAFLGTLGLAVGMALSGALQNFAGGVILLVSKPLNIGDFVEIGDKKGTVDLITILNTKLVTPDNKVVFVPNNKIISGEIVNYTKLATRRVDMTFSIPYDEDVDRARAVIQKEIDSLGEIVLSNPEPFIGLGEMADSAIILYTRMWTKTEDYWTVFFDMQEKVKKAFDANKINIPFPQQDIHIVSTVQKD
ncbi:MAG: mechanosensitive ion channel family protein [Bacteroidales bacterium]